MSIREDADSASKATGIRSKVFINAFLREFKAQGRYYQGDHPSRVGSKVILDLKAVSQILEREAKNPSGDRDEALGHALGRFMGAVEFGIPDSYFPADPLKEEVLTRVNAITGSLHRLGLNVQGEFIQRRIEKIVKKNAKHIYPVQKEILAGIAAQFASLSSPQATKLNEKEFLALIEAAAAPGERKAILQHYRAAQKKTKELLREDFKKGQLQGKLLYNLKWYVYRPLESLRQQLSGPSGYPEGIGYALGNFMVVLKIIASPECRYFDEYLEKDMLRLTAKIAELFKEVKIVSPTSMQKAILFLSRSADNEMKREFLKKVAAQLG